MTLEILVAVALWPACKIAFVRHVSQYDTSLINSATTTNPLAKTTTAQWSSLNPSEKLFCTLTSYQLHLRMNEALKRLIGKILD